MGEVICFNCGRNGNHWTYDLSRRPARFYACPIVEDKE